MQLKNFWTGKNKLWQAWIIWFGSMLFLYIISMATICLQIFLPENFSYKLLILAIGFFILILLSVFFAIVNPVIVWRCSINSKAKIWGWITRIFLCVGILITLYGSPNWEGHIPPIPLVIRCLIITLLITIAFSWPKITKIADNKKEFIKHYYIVPWCIVSCYLLAAAEQIYYWQILILQFLYTHGV